MIDIRDDLDDAKVIRAKVDAPTYTQQCPKCRGTGRFVSYTGRTVGGCFVCKGTGSLTFKTKPEHRAKARASAAKRRGEKAAAALEAGVAWIEANPEIGAWLNKASARRGRLRGGRGMIAALKRQWREDWSEIVGGACFGGGFIAFVWLALAVFNPMGG